MSLQLLGGVLLASIIGASGYTLYSRAVGGDVAAARLGADIEPVAQTTGSIAGSASAPPATDSFASRFAISNIARPIATRAPAGADAMSFADRFAAPPHSRASTASLTPPRVTRELIDGSHALGSGERFSTAARPRYDRKLVAMATDAPPETPSDMHAADTLAGAEPPSIRQLAQTIPVPAPRPQDVRPSELRVAGAAPQGGCGSYSHDALVQRARAALASGGRSGSASLFDRLFGAGEPPPAKGPMLAYAGSDGGLGGDTRSLASASSMIDRATAVYDITAKKVYLPNGTTLEAHSGLGSKMDDPRYAHVKMNGVTPPHVYDITPREALFHGVPALRLTPLGGAEAIYGRTGLLAHTYLLGPNGDSNGCVSFKDYYAFLRAYRNGEVKRLIVVASMN